MTVLEAMKILPLSCSELSPKTIRNCFRKAGKCNADDPYEDLEV